MHISFTASILLMFFGIGLTQAASELKDHPLELAVASSQILQPDPVRQVSIQDFMPQESDLKDLLPYAQQQLLKNISTLSNLAKSGTTEAFNSIYPDGRFVGHEYDGASRIFMIELAEGISTIKLISGDAAEEVVGNIRRHVCFRSYDSTHKTVLVLDSINKDEYSGYLGSLNLTTKQLTHIVNAQEPCLLSPQIIQGTVYYIFEQDDDICKLIAYNPVNQLSHVVIESKIMDIIDFGFNDQGLQSFIKYRQGSATKIKSFRGIFEGEGREEPDVTSIIYFNDQTFVIKAAGHVPPTIYQRSEAEEDILLCNTAQLAALESIPVPVFPLLIPYADGSPPTPVNVWLPHGTTAKKQAPLLIWVHGGPQNFVKTSWDPYFQFIVNNGYGIAAVDYTGSSGYGHNHRMGIKNGDIWKGAHEVAHVTRILKESSLIDSSHVTFVGHSHGGFLGFVSMVNPEMGNLYTGGIVSLSGISNWVTRYSNRGGITYEAFMKEIFGHPDPLGDREYLPKISPLTHVIQMADLKVPCLIVHGSKDENVPVDQSRTFVQAAAQAARENLHLHYVEIPNGDHDFTGPAQKEMLTALMTFWGSRGETAGQAAVDPRRRGE